MTHVHTEIGTAATASQPDMGRFTRLLLAVGLPLLALNVVGQVTASRGDDDADVREAWLSDTIAVITASLLFALIAYGVVRWAVRGTAERQSRVVIGLAVLAVLLVPIAWWSSAPALVALQALLLGMVTGTTSRETGSTAARAASVVAGLVVLAVLVLVIGITVAEQL